MQSKKYIKAIRVILSTNILFQSDKTNSKIDYNQLNDRCT